MSAQRRRRGPAHLRDPERFVLTAVFHRQVVKPPKITQKPSDLLSCAQPAAVRVNIHHVEVPSCARLKRFFVVVERDPRQPAVNDHCRRINLLDSFIRDFEELRVCLGIRICHPEMFQVLFIPDFPVLDAILKVRHGSAHIFEPGFRMIANRAGPGHRVAEDHEQIQAPRLGLVQHFFNVVKVPRAARIFHGVPVEIAAHPRQIRLAHEFQVSRDESVLLSFHDVRVHTVWTFHVRFTLRPHRERGNRKHKKQKKPKRSRKAKTSAPNTGLAQSPRATRPFTHRILLASLFPS